MSIITLNDASLKQWQDERLEHLRFRYDLTAEDTVIDLGAYLGEWASEIYARYRCKLVCVEPTGHCNHVQFAKVISKAAGTHNGKMSFGGAYYYTSSFEPGTVDYECFDINELLQLHEEIALLKINIEGGEYDLLQHIIDNKFHQRIKNIQVQFHQIDGRPYERWYKEIETKLLLTHSVEWRYPFCWESWGRKPQYVDVNREVSAKGIKNDFR
jgi:FkbM family methyltransferase